MLDHQRWLEYCGRMALTGLLLGALLVAIWPMNHHIAIWLGVAVAPLIDKARQWALRFFRQAPR